MSSSKGMVGRTISTCSLREMKHRAAQDSRVAEKEGVDTEQGFVLGRLGQMQGRRRIKSPVNNSASFLYAMSQFFLGYAGNAIVIGFRCGHA